MTPTAELLDLKDRHRATWAAGDYDDVVDVLGLERIGRRVVESVGAGPQSEVLDVATGSGNAAIPAARTGARVVGLDLVPGLLEAGRRRAGAAGVEIEWMEGDAEDLPFADGSFDAVLSTLGVQFAPRHAVAARELARVCRPGGTIGLANWTPEGFIGRFFKTLAPYAPPLPDGASPPPLWGDAERVQGYFAGTGVSLAFERAAVTFERESPAAFIDYMAAAYGPLVKLRQALEPKGRWTELRRDLVALSASLNTAGDGGFEVASEYLLVIGRKEG
jgi:SAM-dependent methyltransferase